MAYKVEGKAVVDTAALGKESATILTREATRISERVSAEAKARAPVAHGNLRRSIKTDPLKVVGPFRVDTSVTAHADYAAAVHNGRKGGTIIRPKNAKALRFTVGGRTIFASHVTMTPTKPRPFLRDAADYVASTL